MKAQVRTLLLVVVLMLFLSAEAATNTAGITSPGTNVYPNAGKPAAGSQINWSRPLARGLVTALAVNEGSGTNFYDAVWQTNWWPLRLDGTAPGALPPAWLTPLVSPDYPWGGPAINNRGGGSNALQIMGNFTDNLIATNTTGFTYGALVQPLDTSTFGRITDSPAAVMVWYLNTPGRPGLFTTTWFAPGGGAINPTYPFTVNKWILVMFTVQPGLGIMYVNGTPVTTNTTVSLNHVGQSHPVAYNGTIGPGGHGGSYMCNANFSSWWIWNNRVLSSREVAQMYTNPWSMFHSGAEQGLIKGTKAVLTTPAVVRNVSFYSHAAAGNLRLAIYDNASPKQLLWQSGSITNTTTEGWITVPVTSGTPVNVTLVPGTYWLAWQADTAFDVPSFTAGTSGDGFLVNQSFGDFPATLTTEQGSSETWSMYFSYESQPSAPVLTPVGFQLGDTFEFQMMGSPNTAYGVLASTNLTNWLLLDAPATDSTGLLNFRDTNAPGIPRRFYRAVWQLKN